MIHLAADVDTVVDRLRRRAETDGRTTRRHAYAGGETLTAQVGQELAIAREVVEVLADRDVAVTIIDATRPATDNVDRVADVLRDFTAR